VYCENIRKCGLRRAFDTNFSDDNFTLQQNEALACLSRKMVQLQRADVIDFN